MTTTDTMTEQDLMETIERIRPVVEHYRDQGEQERNIRNEVIEAMHSEGLFRLKMPREYGGDELELTPFVKGVEALARIDSAAGWSLANLATGGIIAALMPKEGADEVFTSDALGIGAVIPRGRAIPADGGYRVSGRWPLASGAHHANWLLGNCLVFEGEAPRMGPHGMPDFTMVALRAEDCQVLDTWNSNGMRGSDSCDFVVEDVFVPAYRSISLFTAEPRLPGAIFRLRIEAQFFTALSCVGLGIARAAIDSFVELAKSKTPTLSQDGLAVRPTVHAAVARAEARLQAASAYMHEVTREIDDAVRNGGVTPAIEARRRLACVNAAEACEEVVDSMFRLSGTSAIYNGHVLDRCLRDIHTVNQHMAVSPFWWEKTGQFYFGQELGMP